MTAPTEFLSDACALLTNLILLTLVNGVLWALPWTMLFGAFWPFAVELFWYVHLSKPLIPFSTLLWQFLHFNLS